MTESIHILEGMGLPPSFLDDLQAVMILRFGETVLPEIFDIFGREHFLRFLDIFQGQTIQVPASADLLRAFRDVRVYSRLSKVSGVKQACLVRELAEEYELSQGEVRAVYYEVEEALSKVGGCVRTS